MSCCTKCFELAPTTAGAESGKYTLEVVNGQPVWFAPSGTQVVDTTLIAELTTLTDTEAKQASASVICEEECHLADVFEIVIDTPGVDLQFWTDNAVAHSNDLSTIFTGPEDLNCLPTHPNDPDITATDTDWSHNDSTFGAGGAGAPVSQTVASGWVIFPEEVVLEDNNGAVETARVYIGECGKKPEVVGEWLNTTNNNGPFTQVSAGLTFIGYQNSDPSANSGFNLRYSTDGGVTFSNIPAAWVSAKKPKVVCHKAEVCPKSNKVTLLDGREITVDGISFSWKNPCKECCGASGDSSSSCEDVETPLTTVTGTGDIPAGLKSVTINNLAGITTINGQFQLGDGRRVESISFSTDRGNCKNETLPAYTVTGGTFQWIGHRE